MKKKELSIAYNEEDLKDISIKTSKKKESLIDTEVSPQVINCYSILIFQLYHMIQKVQEEFYNKEGAIE